MGGKPHENNTIPEAERRVVEALDTLFDKFSIRHIKSLGLTPSDKLLFLLGENAGVYAFDIFFSCNNEEETVRRFSEVNSALKTLRDGARILAGKTNIDIRAISDGLDMIRGQVLSVANEGNILAKIGYVKTRDISHLSKEDSITIVYKYGLERLGNALRDLTHIPPDKQDKIIGEYVRLGIIDDFYKCAAMGVAPQMLFKFWRKFTLEGISRYRKKLSAGGVARVLSEIHNIPGKEDQKLERLADLVRSNVHAGLLNPEVLKLIVSAKNDDEIRSVLDRYGSLNVQDELIEYVIRAGIDIEMLKVASNNFNESMSEEYEGYSLCTPELVLLAHKEGINPNDVKSASRAFGIIYESNAAPNKIIEFIKIIKELLPHEGDIKQILDKYDLSHFGVSKRTAYLVAQLHEKGITNAQFNNITIMCENAFSGTAHVSVIDAIFSVVEAGISTQDVARMREFVSSTYKKLSIPKNVIDDRAILRILIEARANGCDINSEEDIVRKCIMQGISLYNLFFTDFFILFRNFVGSAKDQDMVLLKRMLARDIGPQNAIFATMARFGDDKVDLIKDSGVPAKYVASFRTENMQKLITVINNSVGEHINNSIVDYIRFATIILDEINNEAEAIKVLEDILKYNSSLQFVELCAQSIRHFGDWDACKEYLPLLKDNVPINFLLLISFFGISATDVEKYLSSLFVRNVLITSGIINSIIMKSVESGGVYAHAADMMRRHNIKHPVRYTVPIFKELLSGEPDPEKKNVLIIMSQEDWNGAFYAQSRDYEKLLRRYNIFLYEASGGADIVNAFKDFRERSGSGEGARDGGDSKIDLLILSAHGSENMMKFGHSGKKTSVMNVQRIPWLSTLEGLMGDGSKIIINSCRAAYGGGKEENVASALSATFPKATVFAPSRVSTAGTIKVDDEGYVVSVKYAGASAIVVRAD